MWLVTAERIVKLALGVALIWHQAAIASTFNPYVFTGGLTLIGATEAVRWDLARRGRSGDPHRPGGSNNGRPPLELSEREASRWS